MANQNDPGCLAAPFAIAVRAVGAMENGPNGTKGDSEGRIRAGFTLVPINTPPRRCGHPETNATNDPRPTGAHGTPHDIRLFPLITPRCFSIHFTIPQSLENVLVHLVFSTKDRQPWIADDWRDDLRCYIGGIIRRLGSDLLAAGSVEDHVHLMFPLPRTIAVSELVKENKSGSTRWVHESPPRPAAFHWQSGYGIFSISPGHKETVCRYIANQREHHTKTTFQEEYLKLLSKYGIEHDERFVWE